MSSRKLGSIFISPIFGVLLIVIGLWSFKDYMELKARCTDQTTATIFYNEKHGSKNKYYTADAAFKVGEDDYYVTTGSRKIKYTTGKKILVKYDPADPKVNYSPTYPPSKGIVWFLFGAGELALFIIWLLPKRNRDKGNDYY